MAKKSSNKSKVAKAKVVAKGKASPAKKPVAAKKKAAPTKAAKSKSKPVAASKTKAVKPTAKKVDAKLTGKKPDKKTTVKPVAKPATKAAVKAITVGKSKTSLVKAKPAAKTVVSKPTPPAKASATPKTNGHTKKPAEVAKPTISKEPVNRIADVKSQLAPEDLARFKAILMQKRSRLRGDVAMMSEEALGGEEGAVDNHAPIHPAEVGSHSFEQEFTLDLLSHDGDRIQLIEMALEKLDEGTYGQCDECGARIPKGRLEMLPESIFCVKCATRIEGSRF